MSVNICDKASCKIILYDNDENDRRLGFWNPEMGWRYIRVSRDEALELRAAMPQSLPTETLIEESHMVNLHRRMISLEPDPVPKPDLRDENEERQI